MSRSSRTREEAARADLDPEPHILPFPNPQSGLIPKPSGRWLSAAARPPRSHLPATSASARLIQALLERDVNTFFGVPGGPVCAVFEAIRLAPGARLIESRHESHAAFAASLFYRASGRIPCVVVTAGPGITNAVTGIASASLERIPMLVIAGDVAWATTGACLAQDSGPSGIDMEAMLAPVTRAQIRAAGARSVVSQALQALDIAQHPLHPGPVLLALPLDRSMQGCSELEVVAPARPSTLPPPVHSVARTVAWLREAKRPLIVIGAGCRGHEAALRALVDTASVAFVTTPRAKGLIGENHPCSLRNGGMAASMWARHYTQAGVDVCLVLGTDIDDTSMGPTPYAGASTVVVHVDTNAGVFGRNLPTRLAVTADVGEFALALTRQLQDAYPAHPLARAALLEARRRPAFDVPGAASDPAVPIRPHRLMLDLEAAAPPRAAFVSDIGEHMLFALHYLTARRPDRFYLQLNLGSMGSGIAGAVGLALADRERPVICIAGDGGMQMAGMEALVAVRERLSILFVILNDGRYNMVHHGMAQIFGEAQAYDTPPVDFARWASSLGMPSRRIAAPGQVSRHGIEELLRWGGPALLDVHIDAQTRIRGGGRVEALQHMSMLGHAQAASEGAK